MLNTRSTERLEKMAVKTRKNIKLTGNKYKSVTQMVNKLAFPKFKKEWRELQKVKEKKVKEVKAWGLSGKTGHLMKYTYRFKQEAQNFSDGMNKLGIGLNIKVIRVSIKEIK